MKFGELLKLAVAAEVVGGNMQGLSTSVTHEETEIDLGVKPEDVETEKCTLCTVLLDDSGSMERNVSSVLEALNGLKDELVAASPRNDVLVSVVGMFGGVITPYTRYQKLEGWNYNHYRPGGGYTPLFRKTIEIVNLVVAKQAQLAAMGIPTRTMTLLMTDGGETEKQIRVDSVNGLIKDISSRKGNKVWGVAFNSGDTSMAEARDTMIGMGLTDDSVKDAGSALELSKVFQEFSRATSAVASS